MTPNIEQLPIDGLILSRPHKYEPDGWVNFYRWGNRGLLVMESPRYYEAFEKNAVIDATPIEFHEEEGHAEEGFFYREIKTDFCALTEYFSETDEAAEFIEKAAAFFNGEVAK